MTGTQVGRYQIQERIGKGGMGVVYKAFDPKLARTIALKFLLYDQYENKDAHQRFIQEAKTISALDHPNICTIHDIGESDEGNMYIAMAYYEGETLKARINRGPLPVDEAIELTLQIAKGLREAHKKGVVHRDVKPANIFVTGQQLIKVLDFGLAKVRDIDLTKDEFTMGTATYMSPEQARGLDVDHRTDIWSLGVILYEMLAGRRPFKANFWEALVYMILHEEADPLSKHAKGANTELENIVAKALSKRLDERYRNMDEFIEALHALKGTPVNHVTIKTSAAHRHAVGRNDDLAQLNERALQVVSGAGMIVGIAGDAGMGKTVLIETFLDGIEVGGMPITVAKGQCSERLAGSEAYLPLFDVMEHLLAKDGDGSVNSIMRKMAPWWYVHVAALSPDDPDNQGILEMAQRTSQEQIKRELTSFLKAVSDNRLVVVVIEDLHWADVSSVDMIAYLGARFDAMNLLILTTYRPVEMQLNKHPFLQIKSELTAKKRCHEIELEYLDKTAIDEYLSLEYPGHTFPEGLASLVHQQTEGSPLFMADLIKDLEQRKILKEVDGKWTMMQDIDELQVELPNSAKAMIELKIDQLDAKSRQLMAVASVQGFEFDSVVVAECIRMV